jgi:hypothetical protein
MSTKNSCHACHKEQKEHYRVIRDEYPVKSWGHLRKTTEPTAGDILDGEGVLVGVFNPNATFVTATGESTGLFYCDNPECPRYLLLAAPKPML